MIELTGSLGVAIGLLAVVALLHYLGQGKKARLGVALVIAAAAFMLVAVGFEFFSELISTYGDATLAEQVERAGIYIGYSLSGVCVILGVLIIALKNLLRR